MGSVASIALPVLGGAGGFMMGGMGGMFVGATLGSAINNLFFEEESFESVAPPTQTRIQHGARLGDLRVQLSSYGDVIPKVYGTIRIAGNVIWAIDIKEVVSEHGGSDSILGGGKGGGITRQLSPVSQGDITITYSYFATLAIAICEGEVDEIIRIWADSELLHNDLIGIGQGKFNIHLGSEDQLPDDIIGKYKSAGTYPAYRGLCYVVLEDFPLEQYGNRIPNFTFEVRRTVRFKPAVEEKIKEVILIPGAGEFVYADKIHYKQSGSDIGGRFREIGVKEAVNMHNYAGVANANLAIEQMAKTLPNLEWVALVVTWFATSSKAADCRIIPKVEYHDENSRIAPSEWQVAGITRDQAESVLRFDELTPTYGGTPSDETVVAICKALKARGYKIMLYPMIFVDEITPKPKPWRGRITANNASEINNWFNNAGSGYNRFIMHYANLVSSKVDAFVIGSEMIGLTSFTDHSGSYPAVDQFISLAGLIKARLGNSTLVTYAADWSEYHHTIGGWFNLDPLWASSSIDFVGIDAYFPLTEDLPYAHITEDLIKRGWESGEGWEYYYDWERKNKRYFASDSPHTPYKYAWKNVEYWWSSRHQNPDGSTTAWQPKMKPIWFTEFGFPSVDACSNQPNVFYDPSSIESYFPRGSKGKVNFPAQRQALNATLEYLEERTKKAGFEQLIPKRFVWTYDARPFPFWPDFKNVWQDGILWATGHWINGKLGISNLGAIVAELLSLAGLKPTDYDVTRLTDDVAGFIISGHITAREAIEQLQSAYFFDAVESDGILKFMPRLQGRAAVDIREEDLVPGSNKDIRETLEIAITQELELPQRVSISHIDAHQNYDFVTVQAQRQTVQTKDQINLSLPLVFNNQAAQVIADIILYNAWQERIHYKLTLPPKYAYLEPTDIINVINKNITHQIRIVKTDMQRSGLSKISGISFNVEMYDFDCKANYLLPNYELPTPIASTILELIDAPPLPFDHNSNQPLLRMAVVADASNWRSAAIYKSTDEGYDYKLLTTIAAQAGIGVVLNKLEAGSALLFDEDNEIIVQLMYGTLASVSEQVLLNGANVALIGDELVQFQNAELIGDKKYKLTKLLRGRQGTEHEITSHKAGDRFVLLSAAVVAANINNQLIGKELLYKPVSIGKTLAETKSQKFTYNARCLKPFSVVHVSAVKDEAGNIILSWIRRSRIDNSWRDNVDIPLGEDRELYQIDIKKGKNIIRTLETATPNVTYTKEQQDTDFEKLPKKLTATIYQLSSQVGRGYATTITL